MIKLKNILQEIRIDTSEFYYLTEEGKRLFLNADEDDWTTNGLASFGFSLKNTKLTKEQIINHLERLGENDEEYWKGYGEEGGETYLEKDLEDYIEEGWLKIKRT